MAAPSRAPYPLVAEGRVGGYVNPIGVIFGATSRENEGGGRSRPQGS